MSRDELKGNGEAGGTLKWKQRAVERSTQAAKRRAELRVERFLATALELMAKKGTTDFTVQEVVDRSGQSLRGFYQHFGGKHELLLAMFEDALARGADDVSAAASTRSDPVERLKVAIELLFEQCRPGPSAQRPLFTDFAPRLLVHSPAEVRAAHAPIVALFTEYLAEAQAAGVVRSDAKPRRIAAMVMQTVMFNAQSGGTSEDANSQPLTAHEVWEFCAKGFTGQLTPQAGRQATDLPTVMFDSENDILGKTDGFASRRNHDARAPATRRRMG